MDNKKVYETTEMIWSTFGQKELQPIEKHMIESYLTRREGRVIEGGTGSGRLAFHIEQRGFTNIDAYDYLPQMIEAAELYARRLESKVRFKVADAVDLNCYAANEYDYAVYLQQVICFIPLALQKKAIAESYRILKPGGVAIFSALNFAGRPYNGILSRGVNFMRGLYGEEQSEGELPWLKLNGKFNWRLFSRKQARVYWFQREELRNLIESVGYRVVEIRTAREILGLAENDDIGIYLACIK